MMVTGARKRIGWVVDAQEDFLRPDGRLYVVDRTDPADPGAEAVIQPLSETVRWMREHCALTVYTADWHGMEDDEIDAEAPNFESTFPPHCMGRSVDPALAAGAEIIAEVRPGDPLVLSPDASDDDARRLAKLAVERGAPILIQKVRFCVFSGNPASGALLAELAGLLGGDLEVIVAGVARDVCVKFAVEGLVDRGFVPTVVRDAVWGLGLEDAEAAFARWSERGRVIDVADLRAEARAAAG